VTETPTRALYDLHLHTHYSYDAHLTLREIFAPAAAYGIKYLAITEHHVLDAHEEALQVAAQFPEVVYLPGAELTVHTSVGAVDLVCLGFTQHARAALGEVWDTYHEWQRSYGAAICRGMQAIGLDYTDAHREELLRSYRPQKALDMQGMTHVANGVQRAYFLQRGFIGSEDEYSQVLAEARKAAPFPNYPAVEYVVPRVKEQGVLVAIAHPYGYFQEANLERMDMLREECMLDGIECAHPGVPEEFTPIYREYCVRHGLVSTGGSDVHRPEQIEDGLGVHIGPDEWWPEIEARLPQAVLVNA